MLVCLKTWFLETTHLSGQHGSQQGHPDVHAVLRLAEIRRPRVRVHLHTERETHRGRKETG